MAAQPIPVSLNDGLPASVQTEVTVLGAMLLDSVAIVDATEKLRPEDFLLDSHQRIYRAILELQNVGHAVDTITVMDALNRRKELDAIGGPAYLAFLTEGIPRNPNIESYVRIVKDKSLLRQLLGIFNEGMAAAADQSRRRDRPSSTTSKPSSPTSPTPPSSAASPTFREIVANSFGSIDALYEQGREITGLATHYIEFDRMTSGLQNSELIIIAARPSMGKTAWAINIAQNAPCAIGKVVAVFSLEMSKESCCAACSPARPWSARASIQTGFIPREDRGKLISALERLMDSKIFIDDTPGITLAEMRAKARRLQQQEGGLDLIVIDYLQLMTGSTGASRKSSRTARRRSRAISRGLKALAKEMKVPVVALSQLSRASEQRSGDKKPLLCDLRESGSIEQDADVVALHPSRGVLRPRKRET